VIGQRLQGTRDLARVTDERRVPAAFDANEGAAALLRAPLHRLPWHQAIAAAGDPRVRLLQPA
jgi:hypothetical protein